MSNLDSLVLEPIEQPLSNTPNMLSNEDRVLCNMTPLQRLYSIDEDTYEELVCVWAYSCLGNKGYTEVYRVGQAGDKGRDVLAYYDRVKASAFSCDIRNPPVFRSLSDRRSPDGGIRSVRHAETIAGRLFRTVGRPRSEH